MTKKARTKKVVVTGITTEQAELAFSEFAKADSKIQGIQATMEQKINAIRDEYADELAALQETKNSNFEIMQVFATENREAIFSKRKSYESAYGVFGFRTGNPKLKNIKGFTWASVLTMVKEFLPDYIRTSEELAKDKLLADRDNEEVSVLFPKCGLTIVQDETFYVEPKKENEQQQSA